MRARDSKHRAEELAAVVRWLREQADSMSEAADALGRTPKLARHAETYSWRAVALRDAAARLEQGEHHERA